MVYEHIKNFNSYKGKLWNMSIDQLMESEQNIAIQMSEFKMKNLEM